MLNSIPTLALDGVILGEELLQSQDIKLLSYESEWTAETLSVSLKKWLTE